MNLDFTDGQQDLRSTMRKWVERSYSFERMRAIANEGGFSYAAYRELASLGVCGLYISERNGGLNLGAVEAMIAMEELGRGMVLEPAIQALICGLLMQTYGPAELTARWLPRISSGESLMVLAYQETSSRYCLDRCESYAVLERGAWKVSGVKTLVAAGDSATTFLVSANARGHVSLFLVEADARTTRTSGYQTPDGSRAADVELGSAPATLVAEHGVTALEHGIDLAIAAVCAQGIGAMEVTIEVTIRHLKTRKQFGIPLANFQALRHDIAEMKMHLELARSMSYLASLNLRSSACERGYAVAQAKYQLGVSMRFVGQHAIQLHGAIGLTNECMVSHLFKKLTQIELSFGDTLYQLGKVTDGEWCSSSACAELTP